MKDEVPSKDIVHRKQKQKIEKEKRVDIVTGNVI